MAIAGASAASVASGGVAAATAAGSRSAQPYRGVSSALLAGPLTYRVMAPVLSNDNPRAAPHSIARQWDEQLLAAIRIDNPRPPVHARNLYHLSVAMWDAWAAYDATATQLFHRERVTADNVAAARAEAISHAAYRLIRLRYSRSPGADQTRASLDVLFASLGFDANNFTTQGTSPAALGNRIFDTVQRLGLTDGANEEGNFAPPGGYQSVNPPLDLLQSGTTMTDPNRWQSLKFEAFVQQNGIPLGSTLQTNVCPHWASVKSFAIGQTTPPQAYLDPGPPPQLGGSTDRDYKSEFTTVVRYSGELDPADDTPLDLSPAARLNNTVGTNDGTGHAGNPVTGKPYAPNVVKRSDFGRVLTEYWADGPQSETPPGHWNVLANAVSDDPRTVRRIGGSGPALDRLEWDVKLYLALNGAVHDAAIGAWGLKGKYDSVRPISAIRYTTQSGQSSSKDLPSYNAAGPELVPGLVELVTPETAARGGRHAELAGHVGEIAIRAWRGQPADPATQTAGVGWMLGKDWKPYQKSNFVTPAFAGYTSGHSTFSRAAAEVMAAFTGSAFFPGGLSSARFEKDAFLGVERGPSATIELQWATYFDAADDAGISRLYGGIHIPTDDFTGRVMGSRIGKDAYQRAVALF